MEKNESTTELKEHIKPKTPSVFISHDSRDAEIAEAFSKLLKSVSAGMLKSFRSSDNKGTQGIEYGLEWYPKIIEELRKASDVVCILTDLSINRPWILFEAGMAKGMMSTPILGVAVGTPLSSASTGPFAQFQNCDDELDSLTKLVKQLVVKLPNSEPDEDIIRQQVEVFKKSALEIINKRKEKSTQQVPEQSDVNDSAKSDVNDSAKLFEEVKLMFQELPSKIENISIRRSDKRERRIHPIMIEEFLHHPVCYQIEPKAVIQMILAPYKNDLPWIYESGIILADKSANVKNIKSTKAFSDFMVLFNFTLRNPMLEDVIRNNYYYRIYMEIPHFIGNYLNDYQKRMDNTQNFKD